MLQKEILLIQFVEAWCDPMRQFNMFKNTQAYVTRKIKNVYYARKFSECENARESWSNVNELLKRKKTRSSIKFKSGDTFLSEDVLPNHINNYFRSVVTENESVYPPEIDMNYISNLPNLIDSFFFCTYIL